MTSDYDASFQSQYEQLVAATQHQLHTPLKQHTAEEKQQLLTGDTAAFQPQPAFPPHLAFTLSSPTSAAYPSPPSSAHSPLSQLSQSAPDASYLPALSYQPASSSLLLPHLASLAACFASHQQHVNATLLALQAAVAEERREREAEVKRGKREEVGFRRRLQDRLDELRDDYNERLNHMEMQQPTALSHPALAPIASAHAAYPPPATACTPPLPAANSAAFDTLSRELDSLRQQLHTLRTDLTALTAHTTTPPYQPTPPPTHDLTTPLNHRIQALDTLTTQHAATLQQHSDQHAVLRSVQARDRDERRRELDEAVRRAREEWEERERGLRNGFEAEVRRLTERLDKRDALDRSREAERERERQRQEHSYHEQQAAAATDSRKQQEREEQQAREAADRRRREDEQRMAASDERERQKRVQAEAKAEAELQALRREREEIDRQEEQARQEKLRQQEAERQRLETERQRREQERRLEQDKLQAEEQKRQRDREEAERQKRDKETQLAEERARAEAQSREAEQQQPSQASSSITSAAAPTTTSAPYNLFIRLWNLPLSHSGNNNPIAALFLPNTTPTSTPPTTAAPRPAAPDDAWQYCSQTEWMKDAQHPVFEQALLWDCDASVAHVKVSVYDVVDENVRDEDRLGSAIIPAHLLLAAASSASPLPRPAGSPAPPDDAPVNGLTFRLVHEDAAKQARLGDVILMVECEADQPATPQPLAPETDAAAMLLVRLATVALPSRANGLLPSPIAAAFLESPNGELVYVDQTEWLRRVAGGGAEFEQAMELEVAGTGDGERTVRLSVYDVDSEEVRDEDRVGHVLTTVGELRLLAAAGSDKELELVHEEAAKQKRLRASGSRVKLSVELLADEELEFEVEERKAGRRAAPTAAAADDEDAGVDFELDVDDEDAAEELEQDETSDEQNDEEEKMSDQVVEDEPQADDDDVELVVEATDNDDNTATTTEHNNVPTPNPTSSVNAATSSELEPATLAPIASTDSTQPPDQPTAGPVEAHSAAKDEREEQRDEVDELYSDFAESSSEEEADSAEEEEPQLRRDERLDDDLPSDAGRELPLMPQLASELSDDDSEPSPSVEQQQQHAEEPTTATDVEQKQQQLEEVGQSKADESSSDSGGEIEEEIDVEFGADEDASHFDLL